MEEKRKLTHIVFVLDRSGSVYYLTGDTVGWFNSYLDDRKKIIYAMNPVFSGIHFFV